MSLKTQLYYMFTQTFHESDDHSDNSLKQSMILEVKQKKDQRLILTDGCHSIEAEAFNKKKTE